MNFPKKSRGSDLAIGIVFLVAFGGCCGASSVQLEGARFSSDVAKVYARASQVISPSNVDVIVVDIEESLVWDREGIAVRSRYVLYKVLTEKGANEWSQIALSWEPWHEEHPRLHARVITPDLAEHVLDESTITESPAKESEDNVFSDRRVVRAPLPAVAPGAVVEEESSSTESPRFFGSGRVERFYFGSFVPVQHTRLVLDAPSTLPIRFELRLLSDLKPERTEADGRVRISFEHGPIDSVDDVEPELPSEVPDLPSVTFSTGTSWQQVADQYGKIVDRQLATSDVQSLVARVLVGRKSRDEKANAILQYVDREVRYTGVEFGDAAIVPRPVNETLARKYGDCKDKATLVVAMLRAADIPAYIALLNASSREDVSQDLPGMGMFDHAIVYIPGPSSLWIDATDDYAKLGQLPRADQGRLALVARPDSDALLLTPIASSTDNTLIEKREIRLAENGPARVVETSQPHGILESYYRHAYENLETKVAKDDLASYAKSQYLAERLDRENRSDPRDLSSQFELVLESDHAKRGFTDLNVAVVGIPIGSLFNRLPPDLRKPQPEEADRSVKERDQKPKKVRSADYQLSEAFVTEWQYAIVPPAGFMPKPLPSDVELALGPCLFTEQFTTDNEGVVHAIFRFNTVKARLTVSEAAELRSKLTKLLDAPTTAIYFEPRGQYLIEQGKIREGMQAYRELVALHPNEAVHHLQIAKVLLAAGLGEAARNEAQLAVKLEPNSVLVQKTLGEILEHDLVGRKFRPGSDYGSAEAALRTAERLDPNDEYTILELALLLEYNHWGLRYGPGARVDDAVTEYRKLTQEQLRQLGQQSNVAYALFYGGHFSEAERQAEDVSLRPTALIVACEAVLKNSQAALVEAKKSTVGDENFRQTARAAGVMLVNIRKYSLAADLLEAGASGDNASEDVAFASLYRKTQPREQVVLPDGPAGVALRFELLLLDPDLTLEQLRSVSSRNGELGLATADVFERQAKDIRTMLTRKARLGKFNDDSIDLMVTRAEPKVEGNATSGFKVTLFGSTQYKDELYVLKEENQYRILASTHFPCGIGLEVLDRLAVQDLTGARLLLDWVREDSHLLGGDDPLLNPPFALFWTKGRRADAEAMKVAAALILVPFKQTVDQGLKLLESATINNSDAERDSILLGMLIGYSLLDNYEKALTVSTELAHRYPQSDRAFINQSFNLRALRNFGDADKIAKDRLERIPGDRVAMRALAANAMAQGDYVRAHALYLRIAEEGKAEAEDFNGIAWDSLFTEQVEKADLEYALKGAQLSQKQANILHTLGCLYAEVGQTQQAKDVLLSAMDSLNLNEPDVNYWYAFGRIAEQYGERSTALADYARVTKPETEIEIPDSSYKLAQNRLKVMHAEKQ